MTVFQLKNNQVLQDWAEELARKLLKWRHPGFSAHIGKPILEHKKAIEDVASYLVKAPLSLEKG